MHAEVQTEALRQLDGLAADHLSWLRAVHAALFFGRRGDLPALVVPASLDRWAEAAGSGSEVLDRHAAVSALRRHAHILESTAGRLLALRRRGEEPPPGTYDALMAEAEAFAAAIRRLDAALRQELAEIDPLTGVQNRQGMLRDLTREWTRSVRTGAPCAVAMLDLDHFKQVNDSYGHAAGDNVLCATASFLRRRLRPYDLLYRVGGEEFLLCLPDSDIAPARRVLERIRRLMARLPVRVDHRRTLAITCSIGIALMRPEERPTRTIARADWAMYAAKAAGRNRVCIHPDDAEDDAVKTGVTDPAEAVSRAPCGR